MNRNNELKRAWDYFEWTSDVALLFFNHPGNAARIFSMTKTNIIIVGDLAHLSQINSCTVYEEPQAPYLREWGMELKYLHHFTIEMIKMTITV